MLNRFVLDFQHLKGHFLNKLIRSALLWELTSVRMTERGTPVLYDEQEGSVVE